MRKGRLRRKKRGRKEEGWLKMEKLKREKEHVRGREGWGCRCKKGWVMRGRERRREVGGRWE